MTRRDRTGEPIEDEQQPELHPPDCRRGWLGTTEDERPIPCPVCRPHLYRLAEWRRTR